MKKNDKIQVPLLKDVVVLGKEVPLKNQLPGVLSELQIQALQQQIEQIIQQRLQTVLSQVTEEITVELKTHLEKVLPELIRSVQDKE